MLAVAESKEEVIEALKKDVYYTNKVWDWEKVQIWPVSSFILVVTWLLGFLLEVVEREGRRKG